MPRKKTEDNQPKSIGQYTNIGELKAWKDNPRDNKKAVAEVAKSIKRFGFASPIIANKDGTIIAGHTRYLASLHLGLQTVPVRFLDLDPTEAELLAVADNKIGELADWDDNLLKEIIQRNKTENLDGLGFSDDELNALLAETTDYEDDFSDDDDVSIDEFLGAENADLRQVTLWYNAMEHEEFMSLLAKAQEKYGTTNQTDTVLEVLRHV